MIEIDMKKFIIAVVVILIIWGSLIGVLIRYGENVYRDPCTMCAKRMGETVTCTQTPSEDVVIPTTRYYYPNGSIYEPTIGVMDDSIDKFNWSLISLNGTN